MLARDRECVLAKLQREGLVEGHACEGRLTIEHLLRRAGRRVHGRWFMAAVCLHGNVDGDTSKWRDQLRDYVGRVETQRANTMPCDDCGLIGDHDLTVEH